MAGVRGTRRLVSLVALVALVGSACGDEGEPQAAPTSVEAVADAYVAVLDAMLPDDPVSEDPVVVYVWQFVENPMSLDDQVVVIDGLAEQFDVRFVDQADAAVDPDTTLVPTRDDGLLVGLGPVTIDAPHTVRIEIYTSEVDIDAYLVTLVRGDDTWTVMAQEPVDPEVLGAVI